MSSSIGSRISRASLYIVPAHAIPIAIAVPYRMWGLKLRISCLIILINASGYLNITNPIPITANLFVSSETSWTITFNNFYTIFELPDPAYAIPIVMHPPYLRIASLSLTSCSIKVSANSFLLNTVKDKLRPIARIIFSWSVYWPKFTRD